MPVELSIVIVSYNTRQLLLDCLASIYQATDSLSVECIVVDNASSDGSPDAVRAHYPQVQLILNAENRYFSAAYNQGVELASGRYVLALNPDMVVRGQTLAQLVRQMDSDRAIGAATTMMVFPDGRLQRNGSRFVTFPYLVFNYTVVGKLFPRRLRAYNDWLWYSDWDRTTQRAVDVLPGSCMIASRAIWATTHGFDPRLLMYFSDDYLSRAVQNLGKQTMYLVSDGILHYEGASTRQISARALDLYLRDLVTYTGLRFGRVPQILLALLLIPTWVVQRLKAG